MVAEPDPSNNGGSRPVPDPTVLTDAAIAKADKSIRDWVGGEISVLEERLNGIDEATKLRLEVIDHIPARIDEKVGHLQALQNEKFTSVQVQFKERDTRQERESRDNKLAVDAAFAAQEKQATAYQKSTGEAQAKSEVGTKELIEKLQDLLAAQAQAQAVQIADIKERIAHEVGIAADGRGQLSTRITSLEQQKVGAVDSRTTIAWALTGLLTVLLIVGAIVAFPG